MPAIVFTTLGPSGTNHELVARKYMDFHELGDAALRLSESAEEGLDAVRNGNADYFLICAVHPDAPRIVGRFFREIFIVDSFISPSLPLAVLTRREVEHPRSIGVLHPATTDYVDTRRWERVSEIGTGSLHTVAQGLLEGRYDSGLVYLSYAQLYPDRLRVDEEIGSPDDAWLVLGRKRTFVEPIQAWRNGPVAGQFRALAQAYGNRVTP